MDAGTAAVIGQAILGIASIVVAGIGAWVSITKSEDRAALAQERARSARLRKQVTSMGGVPDED